MGALTSRVGSNMSRSLTRRIINSTGIFAFVQGSGIVCALLRAKVIAVFIGPLAVGLNAVLSSALYMLTQLGSMGLAVSGVRSIAATDTPEGRRAMVAAVGHWAIVLALVAGLLTMVASPLLSLISFGDYAHWWMYALIGLGVGAAVAAAGRNAVLQGTEQLKRLARLTLLSTLMASALAIPAFILWRLESIPWVVAGFAVINGLVFIVDWLRDGTPQLSRGWRQSRPMGSQLLRFGFVLTLSNSLTMLTGYILTTFLNRYATTVEVGFYQAGHTIINQYMGLAASALMVEYLPRLTSVFNRRRRCEVMVSHQMWVSLCFLLPGCLVLLFGSRLFVELLYSREFMAVVPYLVWAVPGGLLRIVSVCWAVPMLAAADTRMYMLTELGSSAVGMVLAIGGYIVGGIGGMGLAYSIWYALYYAAVWAVSRFRYGLHMRPRALLLFAASLLIVIGAQAAYITFIAGN